MPPEHRPLESLLNFFSGPDRILLAPMEGIVDAVMRDLLTRIGGIDLCVTEFIRVTDRLLPDHEFHKYCPELRSGSRTSSGTPVIVQLLGGKPEALAENACRAIDLGASGIDLNFGCPAKTVNRHDGGAVLLKTPQRIFAIVAAVRTAVPPHIPVSAKVRLGFDSKALHREVAEAVASGGANWLTVHARTRDEGYQPPAHWEYIARMRDAVKIPVIANGEIWSNEDYERARDVSQCRHVMIGRGLLSTPDLARQIKSRRSAIDLSGNNVRSAGWSEVSSWLTEFAETSRVSRNEKYAVARTKQWMKQLATTYPEAAAAFEIIKRHHSLELVLKDIVAA
jgi:tRNA-dihydrouridine synthase C